MTSSVRTVMCGRCGQRPRRRGTMCFNCAVRSHVLASRHGARTRARMKKLAPNAASRAALAEIAAGGGKVYSGTSTQVLNAILCE